VAYLGTGPERRGLLPRITVTSGEVSVVVVSEHLPTWWARLRRRAPRLVDRFRWRLLLGVLQRHGFGAASFVGADGDASFFATCPLRPRLFDLMDPRMDGDRAAFDAQLRDVVADSEGAVATARALAEDLSRVGRTAALVPNGCRRVGVAPVASPDYPAGSVGYLGTIDQRVDLVLLKDLVMARPDVPFLLGGRVNTDQRAAFASIQAADNVTYAGAVPDDRTHEFMSALAVGLIPFRTGWVGDRINPVKLAEYAAYGLAVVSSDVAECRDLPMVEVVVDGAGASAAVSRALAGPRPVAAALDFAADNTWSRRAEQLDAVLGEARPGPAR
jgi:glycosyltransferase involved in cell wall biosynthesis